MSNRNALCRPQGALGRDKPHYEELRYAPSLRVVSPLAGLFLSFMFWLNAILPSLCFRVYILYKRQIPFAVLHLWALKGRDPSDICSLPDGTFCFPD